MLRNSTWLVFLPLAPIKTSSAGLLILAFITVMLSFISLLLLGHLLGFHLYLCESHTSRQTFDQLFSPHSLINLYYFPVMCPLEFAVHKGISTYDYVKMKRQKDARNQDTEAASTHNGKTNNNATQVRPVFCLLLAVTSSCWRVFKTFTFSFNRIQTAQLTVSQHYRRVQG